MRRRTRNRWLVIAAGLVFAITSAGTGISAEPQSKGTIGVSLLTLTNPFFKTIGDNITRVAQKEGYSVVVESGDFDVARQQNQIKDFSAKAESFRDTVYEQADSLKPAADKLKLKIETASNVTRSPNPALPPDAPYNNPKFLKALFANDVVKNKHNTEAVEVAPGTFIAGRIVDYKAASTRPFAEVKSVVTEQATAAEAAKLAKQAGEAKLAALMAKDDTAGFAAPKKVSRTSHEGLDAGEYSAVMKADTSKLPAYVGAEDPAGYAVFRIGKVEQPATVDANRRQVDLLRANGAVAQQETLLYIEALKQKNKVKILKPIANKTDSDEANQ